MIVFVLPVHGVCKPYNGLNVLSNSSDEGPGPKGLERNPNQNTPLLFFIFFCSTFPFLLSNVPRNISNYLSVICVISCTCAV